MLQTIRQFLQRHVPRSSPGVVAFSGGPDSTALSAALALLQAEGIVGELTLAHVNHQLRGAESDGDEAFAAGFAARLGGFPACRQAGKPAPPGRILFRACRIDAAAEAARQGDNLESTARRLRYEWLQQTAVEGKASWVATGHTADDQAETVLHRIIRGSGLQGLCGIRAVRPLGDGVLLVRPLLQVSRTQVLAFLQEHGLESRQDSSNLVMDFTRNRIRHDLLPKLFDEYNPEIVAALCRLAEQANEVQDLVLTQAADLLQQAELPRAGELLVFRAEALRQAAAHLVREMFRLVWQREGWPTGRMTFADWQRLAKLAAPGDAAFDLPGTVTARRRAAVIQLAFKPQVGGER